MIKSAPQPSKSRDKTHRTAGGIGLQKDDAQADGKEGRADGGGNSRPSRQGRGNDERGRYGKSS